MIVRRPQRGYLRTGGFYGRFGSMGRRMRRSQVERKFLDGEIDIVTIPDTGAMLASSHNVVVQGNAEDQRIGRKIMIKALHVKGQVALLGTTLTTDMEQRVRVIFAVDKQTNGAAATLADVIDFAGVEINAFRNLANVSRFDILYDRTFNLNVTAIAQSAAGTFVSAPQTYGFSFSKRLNLPIEFDATATDGSLATQRTNNIFAFAIAQEGGTAKDPEVSYIFRIRFTDM